jgi:hypothetical protein
MPDTQNQNEVKVTPVTPAIDNCPVAQVVNTPAVQVNHWFSCYYHHLLK